MCEKTNATATNATAVVIKKNDVKALGAVRRPAQPIRDNPVSYTHNKRSFLPTI